MATVGYEAIQVTKCRNGMEVIVSLSAVLVGHCCVRRERARAARLLA
jgi:hypothetical protein